MLTRIAQFATRYPRQILTAALALAVLCGLFGASVSGHLKAGGFTPDNAESSRTAQLIADQFDGAQPNFIVMVSSAQGVDSPPAESVGERVVQQLQNRTDVRGVRSYWSGTAAVRSALRSSNGRDALIVAYLTGGDDRAQQTAGQIAAQLDNTTPGVSVHTGGLAAVYHEVNNQVTKDLAVAEGIAVPITMVVLILIFGSVIAAALPLLLGLLAIASTLAILRAIAAVTNVSIYAMNLTTALSLALAIDYSLFIVSRYREELARGLNHRDATIRAVQTAGRTVLYSALTVALTAAVLSVFNVYFLQSIAYTGVAVVVTAALAAIVVLPAALTLLGDRVNAWDLRVPVRRWLRRRQPEPVAAEQSRWYRTVRLVMRVAAPVAVVIVAVLLSLGSPALHMKFGLPDDRVLPAGAQSRVVGDALRTEFPGANVNTATTIVLPGYRGDVAPYAIALSKVDGVSAVLSNAGAYLGGARMADTPPGMANDSGQYLTVATKFDPYSPAGAKQLQQLRAVPAPTHPLFGGDAATNQDALAALSSRLPLALGLIALATLVVLFLFTGSVVLPLKALVLNTLSLTASFGAMVWIFQQGHLSGLLGFTAEGYLVPTIPIMMFCLAFGMSMDYEVFLLSRIREAWLESGRTAADNQHAVALGVARTGRIFTAAALLMAIVMGAMVSSKVSFIQLMGLGLTVAVLADATVIRALLAPALMRLLGRANWWAPAPLARWHAKFGLSEEVPADPVSDNPEPVSIR